MTKKTTSRRPAAKKRKQLELAPVASTEKEVEQVEEPKTQPEVLPDAPLPAEGDDDKEEEDGQGDSFEKTTRLLGSVGAQPTEFAYERDNEGSLQLRGVYPLKSAMLVDATYVDEAMRRELIAGKDNVTTLGMECPTGALFVGLAGDRTVILPQHRWKQAEYLSEMAA